ARFGQKGCENFRNAFDKWCEGRDKREETSDDLLYGKYSRLRSGNSMSTNIDVDSENRSAPVDEETIRKFMHDLRGEIDDKHPQFWEKLAQDPVNGYGMGGRNGSKLLSADADGKLSQFVNNL